MIVNFESLESFDLIIVLSIQRNVVEEQSLRRLSVAKSDAYRAAVRLLTRSSLWTDAPVNFSRIGVC
jgi:hypothetical protein